LSSLRATARAKLPVVALGIAGVVFVLSGGLRRTTKLLLRRR